jgi:hypothetical protein
VPSDFHFRPVDPFGFQLSTCALRPDPVFISVEALGLPGLASSPEARSAPPWRFRFLRNRAPFVGFPLRALGFRAAAVRVLDFLLLFSFQRR